MGYSPKGCKDSDKIAAAAAANSLQSCPTLCDLTDGSPPGSSVPGILQARTLEQVAISFSKTRLSTAQKHLRSILLANFKYTMQCC